MSLDQIKTAITNTKDYTDTYYLHLLGEPLLYPNLDDLFKITDEFQKKIKITTNGLLLSKYQDLLLKHPSLNQINISVQSWLNFSLEKKNALIEDLTNFIIKNENKMTIVIRFWNDKNNEDIYHKNLYIYNQIIKNLQTKNHNFLKNDKINLKEIKNLIRLKPYLFISVEDEFNWPSLDGKINDSLNYCLGGKKQLGILNNGDVVLCCLDYLGHTKLGNIFNHNLDYILNEQPYLSFKETIKYHQSYFELCKKCDFRNRFN